MLLDWNDLRYFFCEVGGSGRVGDASGRVAPLTFVPPAASCGHGVFSLLLFEYCAVCCPVLLRSCQLQWPRLTADKQTFALG